MTIFLLLQGFFRFASLSDNNLGHVIKRSNYTLVLCYFALLDSSVSYNVVIGKESYDFVAS